MVPSAPKILLIDSYDSFTHNLAHLIRRNVPSSQIYLIRNDTLSHETLLSLLPCFSAVFVGPGPGSPANEGDVGVINKLWALPDSHLLPVFGVCLGFQSFVIAFGGSLRTMSVVKHGMISRIEHVGRDIFEGVAEEIEATRYHSLCTDLIRDQCPDIDPLAWAQDGSENGRVLMAARHRCKPFWGVQYHPESVCTRGGGGEVICNFWKLAMDWAVINGRDVLVLPHWATEKVGTPWPHSRPSPSLPSPISALSVSHISLNLPQLSVIQVCELLGVNEPRTNFVLLDSADRSGRFTIIGALLSSTLSIRYTLPQRHVSLQRGSAKTEHERLPPGSSIWDWLARFMSSMVIQDPGHADIPFWGGLVGYLSYELGVAELGVPLKHRFETEKRNPDVNLVFVTRSIVLDTHIGCVHIQSLLANDDLWLQDMSRRLNGVVSSPVAPSPVMPSIRSRITSPSREDYVPQVSQCKRHLFVGSSYELCLTAPSTLHIPDSPDITSWELYSRLRTSNPAPHAAYMRLGPTTLLCSSPERFLMWDRVGVCQLRPIKGTLRKTIVDETGKKQRMERKDAIELLERNIKERAENLMIVDLVRHDLGGVVEAADGVKVEQLMGIEEYETVWQMVSVISGKVSTEGGGWEVLRRSLPPGSMTGAPKKRSVELLQDIEGQERGVYSGVCGYWCVSGAGDWAVIIRSCFRYDRADVDDHDGGDHAHFNSGKETYRREAIHPNAGNHEQDWTLGAGGAITALSDPVAEWEEMRVKLGSVGRAFGVDEL
ncbi:ADC synthase [Gautieria morchelliformis]|nr:ADC synthase [Gautieria morchelliformis]